MAGLADFAAMRQLNDALGVIPLNVASASRFAALFVTMPADTGAGGTEVSGGSYARVQFAGTITVNGSTTTASPTLHVASVPAWLAALGSAANGAGVNVYDTTTGQQIGTISTCTSGGTTITLTANAANAVGATDVLAFSAFSPAVASSGAEPATTPCSATLNSQINYAVSSGSWGTIPGLGVYDALTSGNLYAFDYLNLTGAGKYSPCSITSASPGVVTCTDQTFTNGNSVVFSNKIGGSLPTLSSGSWSGLQTVAGVSGNTFNVGLNTTSIGDGLVRPVTPLTVGASPTNVFFPSSSIVMAAA